MNVFQIIAILITLTAFFSYLNYRFIKLPTTIGVMLMALVASLVLTVLEKAGVDLRQNAAALLGRIHFDQTLMQGMLSFLLFAGALHINWDDLSEQLVAITVLAIMGVLISTVIFGTIIFYVLQAVGVGLDYDYCLLFGALISPTDPIAVLGILKTARTPRTLEAKIAGESLFNDGIGVVAFLILYEVAVQDKGFSARHIGALFLEQAVGGAMFGLIIGWSAYVLLKTVDNYQVEVLITLALVSGGYTLASAIHTSGPIAIVVAGLVIGNHGREFAMSARTREYLDTFWELVDEILNAVLFVLIGLEVLALSFTGKLLLAGLLAIPALLLARWASVGLPLVMLRRWYRFSPGVISILTWSGLRGGISVAMALVLPRGTAREVILAITYVLVVFSILVQGLTIKRLVMKFFPGQEAFSNGHDRG